MSDLRTSVRIKLKLIELTQASKIPMPDDLVQLDPDLFKEFDEPNVDAIDEAITEMHKKFKSFTQCPPSVLIILQKIRKKYAGENHDK
jgi:hypothetical protein